MDQMTDQMKMNSRSSEASTAETRDVSANTSSRGRREPSPPSLSDLTTGNEPRWESLELQSRGLVVTMIRYLRAGKDQLASRLPGEDEPALDAPDASSPSDSTSTTLADGEVQRAHASYLDTVLERLETSDVSDLCRFDNPSFEQLVTETISHRLDISNGEINISEAHVASTLELWTLGVLFDTGYYGLATFASRQNILDSLLSVLEQMRADDRRLTQRRVTQLVEMIQDTSLRLDDIERILDRVVLPTSRLIRRVQHQFDLLEVGLLPDECVTHAIERLATYRETLETSMTR